MIGRIFHLNVGLVELRTISSILVFSVSILLPLFLVHLPPIYSYFFILISHHIPLIHISFLFIHSARYSLTPTFTFNPDPPIYPVFLLHLFPDSPLVFYLPFSLAHSCCHWSVLASLSFSYQTELIWLPYQGWVQTGAGQIMKGGSPFLHKSPTPSLLAWLAYVGPSRWRAVGQMRIAKNKSFKWLQFKTTSSGESVRCKRKMSTGKFVLWCPSLFLSWWKTHKAWRFEWG